VAAGTFTPAGTGLTAVPLVGSPGHATTVAVTVEPAGGSPAPTTTPVMTATIV
jgi:anti-sigma-K factor RskA